MNTQTENMVTELQIKLKEAREQKSLVAQEIAETKKRLAMLGEKNSMLIDEIDRLNWS